MTTLGADLPILLRWDLWRARAVLRDLRREPVSAVVLLVLVALVGVGLGASGRRLATSAWHLQILLSFVLAAVGSGAIFAGFWRRRSLLLAGPVGGLLVGRGRLTLWFAARTVAAAAPLLILWGVSAGPEPGVAATAGVAAALGVAAILTSRLNPLPSSASRRLSSRTGDASTLPTVLLISWVALRRRSAGLPVWAWAALLFFLAAAAGRLALANDGPAVAVFAAPTTLACLLLSAPGLALTPYLGRQPFTFSGLTLRVVVPPAALAAVSTLAAAAGAGLDLPLVLVAALAAALLAGTVGGLVFLHTLDRGDRFGGMAASVELGVLGLLAVGLGPFAAVWVLGRGAMLVAQARRRRWLDR